VACLATFCWRLRQTNRLERGNEEIDNDAEYGFKDKEGDGGLGLGLWHDACPMHVSKQYPIEQGGGEIMSARGASLLYETNRISDSGVDALASRQEDQLNIETQVACKICGEAVKMIAAEKAASICHCSRRKIYRWIEAGDLHFFETPDGEVMVCGRSLSQKMDELDSVTDRL